MFFCWHRNIFCTISYLLRISLNSYHTLRNSINGQHLGTNLPNLKELSPRRHPQSRHCFADSCELEWTTVWRCMLDKPGSLVCHAHSIVHVWHACAANYFNEIFKNWKFRPSKYGNSACILVCESLDVNLFIYMFPGCIQWCISRVSTLKIHRTVWWMLFRCHKYVNWHTSQSVKTLVWDFQLCIFL